MPPNPSRLLEYVKYSFPEDLATNNVPNYISLYPVQAFQVDTILFNNSKIRSVDW